MIEDSDNDAATSLWDEVGGATGIGAYNDRAGLTRTTPSACVTCAGFPWPGWGLTTTVPEDQLTLLKQLITPGPRPLLSDAERSYALSLMENVTPGQRWGITGGVPAGVTVALKNGWLPLDDANTDWQVNSVGWVSGDGRDYLIAVLTTGNPTEQYGIDTINALSPSSGRRCAERQRVSSHPGVTEAGTSNPWLELALLVPGEAVLGGDRIPLGDEGRLVLGRIGGSACWWPGSRGRWCRRERSR